MGTLYTNTEDDLSLSRIDSFDRIYAKLYQAVYANILKIVCDTTVAEDLLQDVFLALWEKMEELEEERIPNWLFVVSFNKSLSFLKKSAKINREQNVILKNGTAVVLPEIDEQEFEERLQMVYKALETLPEKKQAIFRQYRMEGKGVSQIAREMELSVHTVKDHLKIAHRQIREYIIHETGTHARIDATVLILLLNF